MSTALDLVCWSVTAGVFLVLLAEAIGAMIRGRRTDEPFAAARDITGRIDR